MGFGGEDKKDEHDRSPWEEEESQTWPSMESAESSPLKKETTSPMSLIQDSGLSRSSPSIFREDIEKVDYDSEDEGNESATEEQHFEEHAYVCKRLERTLGLGLWNEVTGNGDRDFDDWTELAYVIGSQYGTKLDLNVVKTATRHNVSPSALLLCLIYLERLHSTNGKISADNLMSSSELFIVALMSACKYLYDVGEVGDCYNGSWARQCRIPLKTLNRLEVQFLSALDWDLHSGEAEFENMMAKVQTGIVNSQMKYRPSMTYSDMMALLHFNNLFASLFVKSLFSRIAKVVAVLAASYVSFGVLSVLMYTTLLSAPSAKRGDQRSPVAATISRAHSRADGSAKSATGDAPPAQDTTLPQDYADLLVAVHGPLLSQPTVAFFPVSSRKHRQRTKKVVCSHKSDEPLLLSSFLPTLASPSLSASDLNESWRCAYQPERWRDSLFWQSDKLLCA
ncbi:hypothetical protein RvY_17489 [Ramazzottius varieornatus]|uniref:Protein CNPPD1 n=1 Tax=Ramazzottius varieornatus TaxID=947166 RepID=A0A1D1W299_RAMVA|nr:hypothetical protein RvY_17489 [Ramazzottius varieornatus]